MAPIHVAAAVRGLAELRLLVKHGADVNAYLPRPTSLDESVPHQKLLYQRVHDRDSNPLLLVSGDPEDQPDILSCLGFLLDAGANPSCHYKCPGDYLLHCLCLPMFLPVAQVLVRRGADVNSRNTTDGGSALMWAVRCDNPTLVKLLLDAGADPDPQGRPNYFSAQTPLQLAIQENMQETAHMLVTAGASLYERKDINGETAAAMLARPDREGWLEHLHGAQPVHRAATRAVSLPERSVEVPDIEQSRSSDSDLVLSTPSKNSATNNPTTNIPATALRLRRLRSHEFRSVSKRRPSSLIGTVMNEIEVANLPLRRIASELRT